MGTRRRAPAGQRRWKARRTGLGHRQGWAWCHPASTRDGRGEESGSVTGEEAPSKRKRRLHRVKGAASSTVGGKEGDTKPLALLLLALVGAVGADGVVAHQLGLGGGCGLLGGRRPCGGGRRQVAEGAGAPAHERPLQVGRWRLQLLQVPRGIVGLQGAGGKTQGGNRILPGHLLGQRRRKSVGGATRDIEDVSVRGCSGENLAEAAEGGAGGAALGPAGCVVLSLEPGFPASLRRAKGHTVSRDPAPDCYLQQLRILDTSRTTWHKPLLPASCTHLPDALQ